MSKVFQHPLSDYHLCGGLIDFNLTFPIKLPVPRSGVMKKITIIQTILQTGAPIEVFFYNGAPPMIDIEGNPASIVIADGLALGDVFVVHLDPMSPVSHFEEARDGDDDAWIGTDNDGGGAAGHGNIIFTIGRA